MFYTYPSVKDFLNLFPSSNGIFTSSSIFSEWSSQSVSLLWSAFDNLTPIRIFIPMYLVLRFGVCCFLAIDIITHFKADGLYKLIYNFKIETNKQIVNDVCLYITCFLLSHFNILYFPIILPIINGYVNWLNS